MWGQSGVIGKGAIVVHAGHIAVVIDGPVPSSVRGTRIAAAGMTLISGYIDGHRHILARPGPLDGFWNFRNPVMVINGGEIMVDKRTKVHSRRVLDPASNP